MSVSVDTGALLVLDGVSVAYDDSLAIDHVHLAVAARDFVGIVGPSGSGKTTLLRTLLGIVKPVEGTVIRNLTERQTTVRLGYVPQVETVSWSFPVTVRDVVLMTRHRRHRLPWRAKGEAALVDELLDRLGVSGLADRHIRALSGGQQQRVFVARALMGDPDVLLLDEPTSGVDVRTRHEMLHLLADLNAEGLAVVLTTHDLNGIAAHLPKLVCVNRTVIAEGRPVDVLTPENLEATYGAPMDVLDHMGVPMVVERMPRLHIA